MSIKKHKPGFTLVEVAISILIIMILVTGAMAYQYRSTSDVKLSEIQAAASRLSMLLLEGWKGTQGADNFDPVSSFDSEIAITNSSYGPDIPTDKNGVALTLLGYYEIQVEDAYYYGTLSFANASALEPKVLNVTIAWRRDYGQGALEGDEAFLQYSTFYVDD